MDTAQLSAIRLFTQTRLTIPILLISSLLPLFSGCTDRPTTPSPISPQGLGPSVSIRRPEPGAPVYVNRPATVYAIVEDSDGVLRADLIVNGVIKHSQPLTVASRRFDYLTQWIPDSPGQHTLTVVGYDVNGVPGNPTSLTVNAMLQPPTQPGTPTPNYVIWTATPVGKTPTPWFVIVTPHPNPSPLPPPSPYYVVVTATPPPPVPTQTPIVIVVPYGE